MGHLRKERNNRIPLPESRPGPPVDRLDISGPPNDGPTTKELLKEYESQRWIGRKQQIEGALFLVPAIAVGVGLAAAGLPGLCGLGGLMASVPGMMMMRNGSENVARANQQLTELNPRQQNPLHNIWQ